MMWSLHGSMLPFSNFINSQSVTLKCLLLKTAITIQIFNYAVVWHCNMNDKGILCVKYDTATWMIWEFVHEMWDTIQYEW